MRIRILSLILAILCLGFAYQNIDKSMRNLDKTYVKNFVDKEQFVDAKEYSEWLLKNITYKSDIHTIFKSSWAAPKETLQRGYGDCEDFAFLNKEVLNHMGYYSIAIGMIIKSDSHAICIFLEEDKFAIFDNNILIITNYTDPDEFGVFLKDKYNYIMAWELNYE